MSRVAAAGRCELFFNGEPLRVGLGPEYRLNQRRRTTTPYKFFWWIPLTGAANFVYQEILHSLLKALVLLFQLASQPLVWYRTADDDIEELVPFDLLDDDDIECLGQKKWLLLAVVSSFSTENP